MAAGGEKRHRHTLDYTRKVLDLRKTDLCTATTAAAVATAAKMKEKKEKEEERSKAGGIDEHKGRTNE